MKIKRQPMMGFKVLDEEEGIFEAIVAVFNNVDYQGERLRPGAFKRTLALWSKRGRPIPVVFSHQWDNLDALIGEVQHAEEVEKGLYTRNKLDLEEPFAKRVFKKMKSGTLAEFSFAYDVVKGEATEEAYDLLDVDLFEVGPCLVGANPDTELLGIKNLLADLKEGRTISSGNLAKLQTIHDLLVDLGVKCVEPDSSGSGDEDEAGTGKSSVQPSTQAARIAMELMQYGKVS
jgi:HK97 family phage prohead protease